MKKKLQALLLVLCLLVGNLPLSPRAQAAGGNIYLLAANDKMCDLPGGVLPVAVNGVIYVPYSVFDRDVTGVDLGVYYGLSQDQGTILSLYSLGGHLTFWVNMGVCEDNQGNAMSFRAVIRNGIPYVPASAVCSFFGLQYSFLPTEDRGTLIRISNGSASLSDSLFLSSATLAMTYRYKNIIKSQEAATAPAASATPAPSESDPAPAATQSPVDKRNVSVYLAVDASSAQSDLVDLFPSGTKALFLFTVESLPQQAGLVRRALMAGHTVGLLVTADSLAEAQTELAEGNELLAHIARTRTRLVCASGTLAEELTGAGWRCYRSDLTGNSSSAILAKLSQRSNSARLLLGSNITTVSRVLKQLQSDHYTLRQPRETDL